MEQRPRSWRSWPGSNKRRGKRYTHSLHQCGRNIFYAGCRSFECGNITCCLVIYWLIDTLQKAAMICKARMHSASTVNDEYNKVDKADHHRYSGRQGKFVLWKICCAKQHFGMKYNIPKLSGRIVRPIRYLCELTFYCDLSSSYISSSSGSNQQILFYQSPTIMTINDPESDIYCGVYKTSAV